MSAASISPDIIRLLEKISHLTLDDTEKVEDFIDFLLSKKEGESQSSAIVPDTAKDASILQLEQTPNPLPEKSIESDEMEKESDTGKISHRESSPVIIALEEPISEKYLDDIDFADINTRFAKKRDEEGEQRDKKRIRPKELDWL